MIFEPIYLSSSDVPHAKWNAVERVHGNELGPLSIRAIGDFDDAASALFSIDPRDFVPIQIDVGSSTVRGQMSIVDGRDLEVLAKIF